MKIILTKMLIHYRRYQLSGQSYEMNSKYFFEKLYLHQEENFQRTISKINQRYEQRVALEFAN